MLFRAILLSLAAFGLSYVLTPITVPLCRLVGAIDRPDGARKINDIPVPRLGGLGFFLSSAIILLPFVTLSPAAAAVTVSGAIIVAGGVADDTFGLSPLAKFLIQICASAIAVLIVGIPGSFSFFGLFSIPLSGVLGFFFSVFRFVFTVNAVNFSDGLDGLASGLSSVALLSLALFGAANSRNYPAAAALILAFAVIGFMPYNKYHAKVFMGDSGSQFLGLAIAILSIACSEGGGFTLETSLFLAIPTLDTAVSIARRILKGKSPFAADKGHLHHILLNIGVPHPYAVNLLVAVSAIIAIGALLFTV